MNRNDSAVLENGSSASLSNSSQDMVKKQTRAQPSQSYIRKNRAQQNQNSNEMQEQRDSKEISRTEPDLPDVQI